MRAGPLVLGVAAAALAGAIGYRLVADRPATPSVAPTAAAPADPAATLAALEKAAADAPRDLAAQRDLARAYFALGRYADAAGAYNRATLIDGGNATMWAALGEARTLAGNAVTPDAHAAFARAVAIDPKEPRARYFLAVEKDVAGDHRGAVADWVALLRDAPADAPWAGSVRTLVEQVAEREKIAVDLPPAPVAPPRDALADATGAIPGPDAAQMAAARNLTPSQQDEMARGMVDRLAARLAADPNDETGWVRLMRARKVLGDEAGARRARDEARRAFAADPAARARLDAAAGALSIVG